MVTGERLVTTAAFFEFIADHPERDFELVNGRIVEVVANGESSAIALEIAFFIRLHLRDKGINGRLTGADGGYMVNGNPYIPDVALIRDDTEPIYDHGYNVKAPDLTIEVLSPGNTDKAMTAKVVNYLIADTVVWVADPDERMITVYAPGKTPLPHTVNDTLDGAPVLPDLMVDVSAVFSATDS